MALRHYEPAQVAFIRRFRCLYPPKHFADDSLVKFGDRPCLSKRVQRDMAAHVVLVLQIVLAQAEGQHKVVHAGDGPRAAEVVRGGAQADGAADQGRTGDAAA